MALFSKRNFYFLVIILSVCVVAATLADIFKGTPTKPVPWSGGVDTSWYDKKSNKTEYIITTAEQLAGLAKLVNEGKSFDNITVRLGRDIDLANRQWTPIGKTWLEDKTFKSYRMGTFDGCGHKITGLYINGKPLENGGSYGLLGAASDVRNLSVMGNVTIESNSDVKKTDGLNCNLGGIAGHVSGVVAGCVFVGTVKNEHGVAGGVAGVGASVINCSSSADITGEHAVGGIAGAIDCGIADGIKTVAYCTSNGTVSGAYMIGGIVGLGDGSFTISNCVSKSNLIGRKPINYFGGVIGYIEDSDILNCASFGSLTGDASSVGGIVGHCMKSSIRNCIFQAAATADNCVGGIVGSSVLGIMIANCTSTGDLMAYGTVGGIVGYYRGHAANDLSTSYPFDIKFSSSAGRVSILSTPSSDYDKTFGNVMCFVDGGGVISNCSCLNISDSPILGRANENVRTHANASYSSVEHMPVTSVLPSEVIKRTNPGESVQINATTWPEGANESGITYKWTTEGNNISIEGSDNQKNVRIKAGSKNGAAILRLTATNSSWDAPLVSECAIVIGQCYKGY